MRTPLAVLNLWHQTARTVVSMGGVAFALLLVFAQLGFQGAVSNTATSTLENLQYDLVIRSVHYAHLFEPDQVDRRWLTEAQNTKGVAQVKPFWVTLQNWRRIVNDRLPENAAPIRPIAVMACEPGLPVFVRNDVTDQLRSGRLAFANQLLIDSLTKAEYEPQNGYQFSEQDVGGEAEIGGWRFMISGVYALGTGLAANGSAIVNDSGFARISPWDIQRSVSLGLISLSKDANVVKVQQELRNRFQYSEEPGQASEAVAVLTREESLQSERYRWLWQTPIGLIFQLGVLLSLIVGAAIVYMVLATDVAEKLPEYATLLAIGYSRAYLARIVMTQAFLLSILGFLAAWVLAELLYRLATSFSGIVMTMEVGRIFGVLFMGILMCGLSGLLSLRKLWKAEPANLF